MLGSSLGLPGFIVSEAIGMVLAALAQYRQIHIRELILNGHRYYKMSTKINIRNPLKKCLHLNMGQFQEIRGLLWYERLPTICYRCGRIGHLQGNCSYLISKDKDDDLPFGE